jgi:hypothetical protein
MQSNLLSHFQSEHKSVEERMENGKALRKRIPRSEQGEYVSSRDRADPVSILEIQGKTRLPELVPIRYARMLTSPFAFLRGSAAIMAADLSAQAETTGIKVQACGDMHLANFGLFASAERKLIFGINDFDETLPAPWEWDLKRLVASIVVSGKFLRANNSVCKSAVRAAVASFRERIRLYSKVGALELWYSAITERDILKKLSLDQQKALKKITDKLARAPTCKCSANLPTWWKINPCYVKMFPSL